MHADAEIEESGKLLAIDWGIAYVLSRKRLVFFLGFVPATVGLFIAYLDYSHPLKAENIFLLQVFAIAAAAWVLEVVFLGAAKHFKEEDPSYPALAAQAAKLLPKIFLSVAVLVSLIDLASEVLPILILLPFFIWAPFFCVGEFLSSSLEPSGRKNSRDEEGRSLSLSEEDEQYRFTYFSEKSLWELGFARSMKFAGSHLGVTFQILIFAWFLRSLPPTLVDFLTLPHSGFLPKFMKVFLESWVDILSLGIVVGAFLVLLPKEARDEIGLQSYVKPWPLRGPERRSRIRIQSRPTLLFAMVAVSFVLSIYWLERRFQEQLPPTGVIIDSESVETKGNTLILSLRFVDSAHHFRWLALEGFRISFGRKEEDHSATAKQESLFSALLETSLAGKDELGKRFFAPKAVIPRGDDAKTLNRERFVPYFGPLTIELRFQIPKSEAEEGEFSLYYISSQQAVFQGKFSYDKPEIREKLEELVKPLSD